MQTDSHDTINVQKIYVNITDKNGFAINTQAQNIWLLLSILILEKIYEYFELYLLKGKTNIF